MNQLVLSAFILFLALSFPHDVQGAGFAVTPMLQEITLEPGESSALYETEISNETNETTTFEVSVIDFGSLDESGGVAFLGAAGELERKYALASWMQPEASEITVAPAEKRSVKVRIENRDNLSPGGHYGALIFKNTGLPKADTPNVAINQIFASLVFVKKTGGAIYDLRLASVDVPGSHFSFPAQVTPRFENTGNVHVTPRGEVRVLDPFGRSVFRGILNEGSVLLLPETFREYPIKVFSLKKAIFPGVYTYELDYRYDGKEVVETEVVQRFTVPPLFLLAGIVILLGGIVTFRAFRQHRKSLKG